MRSREHGHELVRVEVPELRIVPEELWTAVRSRADERERRTGSRHAGTRPRHLLSGLLRCAACGGPMQVYHRRQGTTSVDAYGCRWHRDRGSDVCAVGLRRPKADVEAVVVAALREAALRRLGDVVARVRDLLRATTGADDRAPLRAELARVRREGERLTAALAASEEQPAVLVREIDARARRARELEAALAAPSVTSIDVARVEQLVLAEVDALGEACARCPAEGRAAVERLVDGPLVAAVVQTAEGPRYEIRGALRACTTVGVPSGTWTLVHFMCAA